MSYYKTFKPTKEAMEKYNVSNTMRFGNFNKLQMIVYCMTSDEKDSVYNAYFEFERLLKGLDTSIKNDVYENVYKQFEQEGKVWFCGWQYSRECDYDKEEVIRRTMEQLTELKMIVKTPDYFDENEKFIQKKNDIEEILIGFEEVLTECWQFEVIKDLEQYIDKSETDDYADDIENNEGTE